jgi:hypothetical protein
MKNTSESKLTVLDMLSENHRKLVLDNRHYFRVLCEILRLTACQNIAQRGHDERKSSINRGNFLEILSLIARSDPIVKEKTASFGENAKYTSHQVQDALLNIMSSMITSEIKDEISSAVYFSILVDESKDIRKQEQMSFVLRYLYNGILHEEFVGFVKADGLDSLSLSNKIVTTMQGIGITLSNCVGQGYDGASVMSGIHNGVQAIIRSTVAKMAVYMHCCNHRLNLAVVDVLKSVTYGRDFFGVLQRLYNFVSGSVVHEKWVALQRVMHPTLQLVELKRLCDTRWSSQIFACQAVKKRLDVILALLQDIYDNDKNADRAFEAKILISNIDKTFVVCLVLFTEVLGHIHIASKYLQSPYADLSKAVDLVENLVCIFEDIRTEMKSEEMFSAAKKLIDEHNIPESITNSQSRTRNLPQKFQEFLVEQNATESMSSSSSAVDSNSFRIHIFYPVIDCVLSELNRRFNDHNTKIMRCVQAFIPSSINFLDIESISEVAVSYGAELEDLKLEIAQFRKLLDRRQRNKLECDAPKTLLQMHQFIKQYADAFYEMERLIQILCTIPVSNASCERSFSTLRLIKTHLRNAIGSQRLHDVAVISIHKERAKKLDLDRVVDRFATLYPNSRISLS